MNSKHRKIYGKFPVKVHPPTIPAVRENRVAIGAVATLATLVTLFACYWLVSLVG